MAKRRSRKRTRRRVARRRRRSYRRNQPMAPAARMRSNPRRRRRRSSRRSSRRRYRRNPPAAMTLFNELGWAGAGYIGTKVVGNLVGQLPIVGELGGGQPLMRIATKAGVAYVAAWIGEWMFGRRVFTPMFVGGAMSAVEDVIKTYIAPTVPMLGDDLSVYPQLGVYPGIGQHYPYIPETYLGADAGDGSHDTVV